MTDLNIAVVHKILKFYCDLICQKDDQLLITMIALIMCIVIMVAELQQLIIAAEIRCLLCYLHSAGQRDKHVLC